MAEKLNSAEFAEGREMAMLKSRKPGSPSTTRLVPEMSKQAPMAVSRDNESALSGTIVDTTYDEIAQPPEEEVDYGATCKNIMEALRQVKGHVILDSNERMEAYRILQPSKTHDYSRMVLPILIGMLIGICCTSVVSYRRHA